MSWREIFDKIIRTFLIMAATGSIAALLMLALKPMIRNYLPKSAQYYLWVLVLAAYLIPFSSLVSLPFATPMAPLHTVLDKNIITAEERYETISFEQYNRPFGNLQPNEQINIISENKQRGYHWLFIVPFTCGVIMFLVNITQYFYFVRKLYHNRSSAKDHEIAMLKRLNETKRKPRLYRNRFAATPMLIGVFRPIIYLPDREYSDVLLEHIILHELAHFRRYDVLIKWIAAIALSIHWFNPFAYFMRRELDRACELACDEAVIKNLDHEGKQSYGNTLIEMAANMKRPRGIVSTTMCEEKKTLKERLSTIMKSKRHTKTTIVFSCVLLAAVLCLIVVLGSSMKQYKGADETQAELLSAMNHHAVPDGLSLEMTSATRTDAEFVLTNMTESIVEYGNVNRVERYVDGEWEAAIPETKAIFPENPGPLQAGQHMYGMAAWVRDNTELPAGTYRYLLLVNVRDGDFPAYPVVLEAIFEISDVITDVITDGTYSKKAEGDEGFTPSVLISDGTFVFTYDLLSSYLNYGSYFLKDGVLILTTYDKKFKYQFTVEDDTLIFDENQSSSVKLISEKLGVQLKNGDVLYLADETFAD